MFTVKVVEQNPEGVVSEHLFEASGLRSDRDAVYADMADGSIATYQFNKRQDIAQDMFVMNRFGATVSTYRL
jgi:hypothetical protein